MRPAPARHRTGRSPRFHRRIQRTGATRERPSEFPAAREAYEARFPSRGSSVASPCTNVEPEQIIDRCNAEERTAPVERILRVQRSARGRTATAIRSRVGDMRERWADGWRNQRRAQTFSLRLDSRGPVGGRYAFDVPALRHLQRKHADVSR